MRRLLLVADGRLLDNEGNVVAVIDSITIDVCGDEEKETKEGKEPLPRTPLKERKKTKKNPKTYVVFDPEVDTAWSRWVELRRPRRTVMPVGTGKQLQRALSADYSVDQLVAMMEALLASDWHRERDQLTLSTIFATKPGGKTFEDQLDTWLARGESTSSSPAVGDATVTDAAVAAAKNTIRQTWGRDSKAAVELREAAVLSLEHHGWKVSSSSNGQPLFSRV